MNMASSSMLVISAIRSTSAYPPGKGVLLWHGSDYIRRDYHISP
jgi:hypothetical protein